MFKHMIYYWYVPSKGWHNIYDLHIKNLKIYKDSFDKVTFIISCDENEDAEYEKHIQDTINKLKDIYPNASFIKYKNDEKLRESKYFYDEIACKLDTFKEDEILFFAHNKGVSTWYVKENILQDWINIMYFENLHNTNLIEDLFKKDSICCVGTYIRKYRAWPFQKYQWHYSGTYMWFSPTRVLKNIETTHETLPKNDRYFTEAFLGCVIENTDEKRVALLGDGLYGLPYTEMIKRMTEEDRELYKSYYVK